jgi:muramoyltetrapeptide carboxypeptidase
MLEMAGRQRASDQQTWRAAYTPPSRLVAPIPQASCPSERTVKGWLALPMSDTPPFVMPPALSPGSRIRVVAPSGPFDRALLLRGIGFLAQRYRVEFDQALLRPHRAFAGTDQRRLEELDAALRDPGVAAIVTARGGYGATRILPQVRVSTLRESPRWFVGFSDVTAMHVEAARLRIASMHAHNVTGLGRADGRARSAWVSALECPGSRRTFDALQRWVSGRADGPLFGGNLTMLFTCAAAGRLSIPPGAVLVIEDVTEHSYRIDRMLTALLTSGTLATVAAVIVGELTDCPAGQFGLEAQEVVRERLGSLGVPLVAGFPCGHGARNVPVPLGLPARVDADRGIVVFNP